MFNFQGQEVFIIFVLALIVLGPERLPEAMRKLGHFVAEVRKMTGGFQQEFKAVVDEPMRQMRESVDMIRDQTDIRKWQSESQPSVTDQTPGDVPTGPETPAVPTVAGDTESTSTVHPTPHVPTFDTDIETPPSLVGDIDGFAVVQSSNTDLREWTPVVPESPSDQNGASAAPSNVHESQLLRDLNSARQVGPFTEAHSDS